jgi:hypothetical protein
MAHIVENTSLPTIFEVLNKVKSSIGAVGKNERNTMQNFNFRGIDAVVNAAAPALNEHGVIITPEIVESNYETVEVGQKRTQMGHVTVVVKYTFWGPSGDYVSSTVLAESMDSGDKACAKAMSVAYRIALLQTLNLPTTDPDPDSVSYERSDDGEVSNVRQMRPAAKKPAVKQLTADQVALAVAAAEDIGELREVWKAAAANGVSQQTVVVNGESITIEKLLYKRSDELTIPKSD